MKKIKKYEMSEKCKTDKSAKKLLKYVFDLSNLDANTELWAKRNAFSFVTRIF